jgi:parvulin-like peptidyl-prolyl isomerase
MFEREKKRIERKLRKEQEKGLSDRFVALLREAADIWIDRALMEQVDPEKDYSKQTRSVARVDGKSIPLGEFVGDLKKAVPRQSMQGPGKGRQLGKEELRAIKERVMDRLITYILVENEALRRNYNDAAFAGLVEKRKAALLVDAFKAKLVYPLAIPTEGELRKYYDEHVEDFKKGYEVWIREMRFQEQRKAEEIHKELRQGASFEFLEAEVSGGMTPRKDTVWVPVDRFAPVVRAAVSGLKVGEVSDVIGHGRKFKIIKLKGKRGGNPVAFSKVEERLKGLVGQEKFKRVLAEYLSRLRKASKIKIHEKNLEEIEDDFWRGMPEKQEAHGTQG